MTKATTFVKTIEEYIAKHHLLQPMDHVVLGVSGGADSVALLKVLHELSGKWHWTLHVVHVNHMLRGDSADADQRFVEQLSASLGLECHSVKQDVQVLARERGESLEEAGRTLRYDCFQQEVDRIKDSAFKSGIKAQDEEQLQNDGVMGNENVLIAVAHHGDDQAETVLHNLVRGSSLKGVGGMSPRKGNIIRPLLSVTRQQIEEYLSDISQEFCTDETNLTTEYMRNRFRLDVIPYLREHVNANVVGNINEFAKDVAESYEFIHQQAEELLGHCRVEDEAGVSLWVQPLIDASGVLRREVLMMEISNLAGRSKDITRKHVESVEQLLYNQVSKQAHIPYGITVRRGYDRLIFEKKTADIGTFMELGGSNNCEMTQCQNDKASQFAPQNNSEKQWFLSCNQSDFVVSEEKFDGNWKNITNDYTKVFDYATIKGTLTIRRRMPGDYFVLDHTGKKKLLKAFFIDEKIPAEERDKIWLVAEGSHILWIVGYRISAEYKTKSSTTKVLKVTVRRNEDEVSDRT